MPQKYKSSQFNVLFDHDDDTHLIFNTFSGAFARIRENEYDSALRLLEGTENFEPRSDSEQELFNTAKRMQFIVEESADEMKLLKLRVYARKYDVRQMGITMIPTVNCNFACPYCYENPDPKVMSRENQQILVDYVNNKTHEITQLSMGWFGGEPLLAWDAMQFISDKSRKACEENQVIYSSSMSTNGWLMTPEKVDMFDSLGIIHVQVTIDGPPQVHNVRRPLRSGGPTFDRILENVTYLCETRPEIQVAIRVNLDSSTVKYIPEMFSYFPDSVKNGAHIYFRNIFGAPKFWDKTEPIRETDMKIDDYDKKPDHKELYRKAQEAGFRVLLTQYLPRGGYCEADILGNMVVDLNCNIHKCTVGFDEEHRVGRILPGGKVETNMPLLAEWVANDPFSREECLECKVLPMCLGGCTFGKICNKGVTGCNSLMTQDQIKEDLMLMYNNIQMESTRELAPLRRYQK